jgi:hypothetical protein
MPETRPPTRITQKTGKPRRSRVRDARAADVGLDELDTETRGEGVGYAEKRVSPATEHKSGRTDEGPAN